MLETLEGRQFLSATTATLTADSAPTVTQGEYVEQTTLTARKAGNRPTEYAVIKMETVYIGY